MNQWEWQKLKKEFKELFCERFGRFMSFLVWVLIVYALANAPTEGLTTLWLKTISLLFSGWAMYWFLDRWVE